MTQLDLEVHRGLTHRCDSWCWLLAGAPGSPCTGAIILQWTEWASLHVGLLTAFQEVRAEDLLRPFLEVAQCYILLLRASSKASSYSQGGKIDSLLMGDATEDF